MPKEKNVKPRKGEKHLTTVTGPQAEAIIRAANAGSYKWIDRSVPGLSVIELWADVSSEYWSEGEESG